ncbi:MAG: hypothetical protein EOO62_37005, partial [Hymenobacter sp.]
MKSVVSFFLACLMLVGSFIPQNDLTELSKLPQLLEHYRFHHSVAGGGLSVTRFLAEHYGSGQPAHFGCTFSPQHQQDHQGLPLHGQHSCSTHVAFLLLPMGVRLAGGLVGRVDYGGQLGCQPHAHGQQQKRYVRAARMLPMQGQALVVLLVLRR